MGLGVDKVFLEVAGRPLVAHTWQRFDSVQRVDQVVLVVRDGSQGAFEAMAARYGYRKPFQLAVGGAERQDSVWNGLEAVAPETEIVAIQDAARPCTSEDLILRTIDAAAAYGAAVAAQRVTDTIKESDQGQFIDRTVDRCRLWSVQTPQTFRLDVIRRALRQVRESGQILTDDTAACEWIGQRVKLVESGCPNPKATLPGDLPAIEALLKAAGY